MNSETGSIMAFCTAGGLFPFMNVSCLISFRCRRYTSHRHLFSRKQIRSPHLKTYSLNVKLFHVDSVQALDEADRLADAVREVRSMVPALSESGEKTGIWSASPELRQG